MHIQCQDRNGGGSEVFVLSEKGGGGVMFLPGKEKGRARKLSEKR